MTASFLLTSVIKMWKFHSRAAGLNGNFRLTWQREGSEWEKKKVVNQTPLCWVRGSARKESQDKGSRELLQAQNSSSHCFAFSTKKVACSGSLFRMKRKKTWTHRAGKRWRKQLCLLTGHNLIKDMSPAQRRRSTQHYLMWQILLQLCPKQQWSREGSTPGSQQLIASGTAAGRNTGLVAWGHSLSRSRLPQV